MERVTHRQPLQGVTNILRFNWHLYLAALTYIFLSIWVCFYFPYVAGAILLPAELILLSIFISLSVSTYVYDFSNLYTLPFLQKLDIQPGDKLVNINAGFDETSEIIAAKYPGNPLAVYDFYDPKKHTEFSIKNARKLYPPYPGTITISTENTTLEENSADYIFLIFAAHEIRNNKERIQFFSQLKNSLTANGKIVVVEHLRDVPNFLAYNIGAFHFHSKATWQNTFARAGLAIESETKITPFISTFILTTNGTPS